LERKIGQSEVKPVHYSQWKVYKLTFFGADALVAEKGKTVSQTQNLRRESLRRGGGGKPKPLRGTLFYGESSFLRRQGKKIACLDGEERL